MTTFIYTVVLAIGFVIVYGLFLIWKLFTEVGGSYVSRKSNQSGKGASNTLPKK